MIAEETAGHGEEDENYFVSMTDMMVGILFVFIIMLMVFALNFREKTDQQEDKLQIAEELTEQIEALQASIKQEVAALDEADAAKLRLLQDIKDRLKVQGLAVEIDEANGVLRLTENAVRFKSMESTLDDVAEANVQKIALVLAETLPGYAPCIDGQGCGETAAGRIETVFIEGHTDFTGGDTTNWSLSVSRAVSTYREMVDAAPNLRALRNAKKQEILSVSGYASTRPISAARAGPELALNRRIDLRFVMEADQRARLQRVSRLLSEMELKIQALRGPADGLNAAAQ